MEWLWLGSAALVGFVAGSSLSKKGQNPGQEEVAALVLNMASDREMCLLTLRRELANYIVRIDADRFLRLYRKARDIDLATTKADRAECEAHLTLITERYPLYTDFDLVGAREHVLYSDALSMYSLEDIEERYLDLVRFHALQRVMNSDWRMRGDATTENDLEHLETYIQKVHDTKFRQRLIEAVHLFYLARGSQADVDGGPAYENNTIAVHRVPHFAENRLGFHFKDTDEYGLYGSFYDDGRDKTYESYFRSDRDFQAENHLDYLRIDDGL